LRSDIQWSLRWGTIDNYIERAGTEILHSVRTGEPAFQKAVGKSFWSYLEENPKASDWFNRQMQANNFTLNIPSLLSYEWKSAKVVVDVGGGTGQALASILKAHSHLTGMLVDQPHVVANAQKIMESAGVEKRCKLVPGDIFKSVPSGADTYLLARVLHDWDDDKSKAILRAIREAIPVGGHLLILECIVPPGNSPGRIKADDISMLLLFGGGRERTEREFSDLLSSARFRMARVKKGLGGMNIIEATAE